MINFLKKRNMLYIKINSTFYKKNMIKIKILSEINKAILERKLFSPADKILIAVSGGQDSMLLLTVLYRLRKVWNWHLGVIHCDHKWHKFSTNQAKQIYRITYNMKIKYFLSIPLKKVTQFPHFLA